MSRGAVQGAQCRVISQRITAPKDPTSGAACEAAQQALPAYFEASVPALSLNRLTTEIHFLDS